jgi:hypothetical protein
VRTCSSASVDSPWVWQSGQSSCTGRAPDDADVPARVAVEPRRRTQTRMDPLGAEGTNDIWVGVLDLATCRGRAQQSGSRQLSSAQTSVTRPLNDSIVKMAVKVTRPVV